MPVYTSYRLIQVCRRYVVEQEQNTHTGGGVGSTWTTLLAKEWDTHTGGGGVK